MSNEEGTCCFCGEECNSCSQACGICSRQLLYKNLPFYNQEKEEEKEEKKEETKVEEKKEIKEEKEREEKLEILKEKLENSCKDFYTYIANKYSKNKDKKKFLYDKSELLLKRINDLRERIKNIN